MNDEELQKLRNQQMTNASANWPGYRQTPTPDTIDLSSLKNLAKKIAGLFGSKTYTYAFDKPSITSASPTPTSTPKNTPMSDKQIQEGFLKYASSTPLATQSGVISQALEQLSPQIDPKLILALALKESGGGRDLVGREKGLNNNYNVMYDGKLINYPDLQTALMGGENKLEGNVQSKGLIKILNSNLYKKYRESGNLEDFFNVYSKPEVGNPPMQKQINDALELMKYWQ